MSQHKSGLFIYCYYLSHLHNVSYNQCNILLQVWSISVSSMKLDSEYNLTYIFQMCMKDMNNWQKLRIFICQLNVSLGHKFMSSSSEILSHIPVLAYWKLQQRRNNADTISSEAVSMFTLTNFWILFCQKYKYKMTLTREWGSKWFNIRDRCLG